MILLIMSLLASVTVHETTLDTEIIENTENQWIAPGFRISEEIVLDPSEYGTPIGENSIGFMPYFVDTHEGEKWRIVLVYDGEVVVLQEDASIRRFPIADDIDYMTNSANGRYVLLGIKEDEQTIEEIVYNGPDAPEYRVVLLDIETGEQVNGNGIRGAGLIGNDGSIVTIRSDAIEFYDNELNPVGSVDNNIRESGATATGYAADGSMLVREYTDREYTDPEGYVLRAYDNLGNILWVSDNEHFGYPMVSENGDYVFVLQRDRLLCLDGYDGSFVLEHQFSSGYSPNANIWSAKNSAIMWESDVSPSAARQDPGRDRYLNTLLLINIDLINITKLSYESDNIAFLGPTAVNANGCSLVKVFFNGYPSVDIYTHMLVLLKADGSMCFQRMMSIRNRHFRYIGENLSRALNTFALDSTGNRIIYWNGSNIHVISLSGGE